MHRLQVRTREYGAAGRLSADLVLGIESSCDEMAAAVVRRGTEIVSSVIRGQDSVHQPYGGVVPELASRDHVRIVSEVVDAALAEAKLDLTQLDAIAVTAGPGLIGSLLAFLCFYWPRVRHRHVSFLVDERGLQIKRGVLWRSHAFLARSRIQHTDVAQGPLQRRLGLARLVVHTAGTHNASTTLSGISHDQAQQMRDQLTEEEDAVSDGV